MHYNKNNLYLDHKLQGFQNTLCKIKNVLWRVNVHCVDTIVMPAVQLHTVELLVVIVVFALLRPGSESEI